MLHNSLKPCEFVLGEVYVWLKDFNSCLASSITYFLFTNIYVT